VGWGKEKLGILPRHSLENLETRFSIVGQNSMAGYLEGMCLLREHTNKEG